MAWNAWNTFSVNGKPLRGGRKEYETIADAMVESGMVAAGYTLISTVCTDWIGRDPVTHELQQNLTLWPGGMAAFADYLHGKGMTLSVYTDAGTHNCCGEPGSLGYEAVDMKTFASWGVDAVGVDYCGGPAGVEPEYQKFADGIVHSGRDMQLGVWNLGRGSAHRWVPAMSRNMTEGSPGHGSWAPHFRSTADIGNYWSGHIPPTMSVMSTVDQIQSISDLWDYGMGNQSGTYPNYGQMVVGVPKDHPTLGDPGLTLVEAQSHFSMWCMFPAMLMATNDVRLRDRDIERILLNSEAIAINQDAWGLPASRITDPQCSGEQWARDLSNGDVAVLILNRGDAAIDTRLDFADVPRGAAGGAFRVRDVQARRDLGAACQHVSFALAPHETAFVRLARINDSCPPPPPAPCATPPPPPPPPPPAPGPCWQHGACRSCSDPAHACPFPVPPLPPCPEGFTDHDSGYWPDADQKTSTGHGKTVAECGAECAAKDGCAGFEVYDPSFVTEPLDKGGSACYTFSNGLNPPFTADKRGLIRTCVKM